LRPELSCPALKSPRPGSPEPEYYSTSLGAELSRPHVFSADVWEAVHRETGLPVVADFYTRPYLIEKVTVERKPLFEALSRVANAVGVQWSKDGNFLIARSTTSFWDRLKEVPNRLLQRWAKSREANSGLPVADLVEMAMLSDRQLDS